jgi:hypothetical protein
MLGFNCSLLLNKLTVKDAHCIWVHLTYINPNPKAGVSCSSPGLTRIFRGFKCLDSTDRRLRNETYWLQNFWDGTVLSFIAAPFSFPSLWLAPFPQSSFLKPYISPPLPSFVPSILKMDTACFFRNVGINLRNHRAPKPNTTWTSFSFVKKEITGKC